MTKEKNTECKIVYSEPVNKNCGEVINVVKGNLIPTEYRKVFWTMLSSQEKWNKVFDKFIERIDELENQPIVVQESTH
jgi:hypothetical protein